MKWACMQGHKWNAGGDKPELCPECSYPENHVYPVVAFSRVKGDKFRPYSEQTQWGQMANEILSREAQDNFLSR